jgi:hypothetical protein
MAISHIVPDGAAAADPNHLVFEINRKLAFWKKNRGWAGRDCVPSAQDENPPGARPLTENVRLYRHQRQQKVRVLIQRRCAPTARF